MSDPGKAWQDKKVFPDEGNGRDKILVYRAQGEDATPEEVVLSIQGYLVKAKMPPITQESEYVACIVSLCHS